MTYHMIGGISIAEPNRDHFNMLLIAKRNVPSFPCAILLIKAVFTQGRAKMLANIATASINWYVPYSSLGSQFPNASVEANDIISPPAFLVRTQNPPLVAYNISVFVYLCDQ